MSNLTAAITIWGHAVNIVNPPAPDEVARVSEGFAATIRRLAGKAKVAPSGGCKLHVSRAVYLGSKAESYSDDSYFAVPFTGELTTQARENIAEIFYSCSNGFERQAHIDEANGRIIVKEYHGIGD